ncbi:transposable element Tc3 transposase [Trichonephila clavipes]|nr:transposable element Tc3 transposase [Trichonephila clavipes]
MNERTVYPPSRAVFTESSGTENHSSNTLPLHTPGAAIASVGKHLPITFLLCESKIWRGGWRAPDMCSKENTGIVLKGKISFVLAFVCVLLLELWFQQDGATCHTARATIDLLKDTFGVRLISRFRPVNWPPRSCDLTPLDYFLWGYVKSLVYADKPQTLDYLEDNIRCVTADIRPQMLEKVIENWTSRLDYIRASRGSPLPETIFKM